MFAHRYDARVSASDFPFRSPLSRHGNTVHSNIKSQRGSWRSRTCFLCPSAPSADHGRRKGITRLYRGHTGRQRPCRPRRPRERSPSPQASLQEAGAQRVLHDRCGGVWAHQVRVHVLSEWGVLSDGIVMDVSPVYRVFMAISDVVDVAIRPEQPDDHDQRELRLCAFRFTTD